MSDNHKEIEVRAFTPEDEARFMSFYTEHQPTWESFRRFWEWRRKGVPHSGGEEATIALEDGNVVGSVGLVRAALTHAGREIRASWQQDSLVSPAMRGRGVGKKLVNASCEGWDLSMAKGTSKAMYGLRKAVGYQDVPNSDYLIRVRRVRGAPEPLGTRAREAALLAWQTVLPMPRTDRAIEIAAVEQFDASFDRLADNQAQEPVFRLRKTSGYLNWRYTQCPGRSYKIFRAGAEEARGAIVVSVAGDRREEGWIVDFIGCQTDRSAAYALLRAGIEHLEAQGVYRIYVFATYERIRGWLRRFGFVATGRSPKFTYRIVRPDIQPSAETFASAPWDFYHGDGDVELYA